MLKKLLKIAVVPCALLFSAKSHAQVDPHFSQYYMYAQWINPALTGVIDGDYRVGGIFRGQWQNIDGGYKTVAAAAEFVTTKDINWGIGVFHQNAGNGGYKINNPTASVTYTGLKLGREATHHINIGLQVGMMDKRFDPNKFTTNQPEFQAFSTGQQTNFDVGAGVMYYDATPHKKINLFAGLSFLHLTQPVDKFLQQTKENPTQQMPVRQMLHGGARINVNDGFSVTVQGILLKQSTAHERVIGASCQKNIGEGMDFLAGANWRIDDAVVPYLGFIYKDFVLGLSYDVVTSQISQIAGSVHAFEISLSYTGRKRAKMDQQPFICPRL